MPPSLARPSSVDLWLCGHHYRSSLAALSAAGALIEFVGDEGNQFFREPAAVAAA
jgi:hypothetical protein